VVEHQLPKLSVVGSIPIARSNLRCAAAWIARRSFGVGRRETFFRSFDRQADPRAFGAAEYAIRVPFAAHFLFARPRHTG
jgi:hypothetical protein